MRPRRYPHLERRLARDPALADTWMGADLRAWRRAVGVSQSELGRAVGRCRNTVQRLEASAGAVPRAFVVACAGAEPSIRREQAAARKRIRNRVAGRQRRKRDREERELAQVRAERGMW